MCLVLPWICDVLLGASLLLIFFVQNVVQRRDTYFVHDCRAQAMFSSFMKMDAGRAPRQLYGGRGEAGHTMTSLKAHQSSEIQAQLGAFRRPLHKHLLSVPHLSRQTFLLWMAQAQASKAL